jgi:hypothetical protein
MRDPSMHPCGTRSSTSPDAALTPYLLDPGNQGRFVAGDQLRAAEVKIARHPFFSHQVSCSGSVCFSSCSALESLPVSRRSPGSCRQEPRLSPIQRSALRPSPPSPPRCASALPRSWRHPDRPVPEQVLALKLQKVRNLLEDFRHIRVLCRHRLNPPSSSAAALARPVPHSQPRRCRSSSRRPAPPFARPRRRSPTWRGV